MTFERWIRSVFDHKVTDPAWHIHEDHKMPAVKIANEHLERLFNDPVPALAAYSDAQLNQGFWFLVDPVCSEYCMHFIEGEDAPRRVASITALFAKLFAVRCVPGNPLTPACFMWWDNFPTWGPDRPELATALLAVMESILKMDSSECQQSALHGLGHWHESHPTETHAIIEAYLQANPNLAPELRKYALEAQTGAVQ